MIGQKILCLGNETELTDFAVSDLAKHTGSVNHGLISKDTFFPDKFGYYHTSIADIPSGAIVLNLAKHFDSIIMLNQARKVTVTVTRIYALYCFFYLIYFMHQSQR